VKHSVEDRFTKSVRDFARWQTKTCLRLGGVFLKSPLLILKAPRFSLGGAGAYFTAQVNT